MLSPLWLLSLQVDPLVSIQASCFAIWHCYILLLVAFFADILHQHRPAFSWSAWRMFAAASPAQICTLLHSHDNTHVTNVQTNTYQHRQNPAQQHVNLQPLSVKYCMCTEYAIDIEQDWKV